MIEQYVRWLRELYADRVGVVPNDPGEVLAGVHVLRRHAARLPREEDFVSITAEEMARRLRAESADAKTPFPPFLKLLDQSADAVRHRIVRAAQKHPTQSPMMDDVPDRDLTPTRLSQLLEAELSFEETLVVRILLAGNNPAEVASRLGVSLRTVYRRIEKIKRRLRGNDA